jgi:hypothetical protein
LLTVNGVAALISQCPQCHAETQDHELAKTLEMVFICKKVRAGGLVAVGCDAVGMLLAR